MNNAHPLFAGVEHPRLGIDIGRVIIRPDDLLGPQDTKFLGSTRAEAMKTPPNHDAFEVIRELVPLFESTWLVSKCGESVQHKSRAWLDHHRFWEATGIPRGNLRFCLTRRGKAPHCEELGITHFIDDRADVHQHLEGLVPHRFLFGPQPEGVRTWGAIPVRDWMAVRQALCGSSAR